MWYVLFEILLVPKLNSWRSLTLQNIYWDWRYRADDGRMQLDRYCWNPLFVMHSCPTAYVIKHFNRALKFFKNGYAMTNFNAPDLIKIYIECFCHGFQNR